jgi:hypothetical protein
MAKFLTTLRTISAIEDIINAAQNRIVLISPYVRMLGNLYQDLLAADAKGVKLDLFYRKTDMKLEVKKQLDQLKHITFYSLEDLHAKCYFNEESMVITSMNLYDFPESKNREMGVLVTKKDDPEIYNNAIDEYKLIQSLAEVVKRETHEKEDSTEPAPTAKKTRKSQSILFRPISEIFTSSSEKGYCIKCRNRIEYDTAKPYCSECYQVVKPNYTSYQATYCLYCGKKATTTLNRPLCNSCYQKQRK